MKTAALHAPAAKAEHSLLTASRDVFFLWNSLDTFSSACNVVGVVYYHYSKCLLSVSVHTHARKRTHMREYMALSDSFLHRTEK